MFRHLPPILTCGVPYLHSQGPSLPLLHLAPPVQDQPPPSKGPAAGGSPRFTCPQSSPTSSAWPQRKGLQTAPPNHLAQTPGSLPPPGPTSLRLPTLPTYSLFTCLQSSHTCSRLHTFPNYLPTPNFLPKVLLPGAVRGQGPSLSPTLLLSPCPPHPRPNLLPTAPPGLPDLPDEIQGSVEPSSREQNGRVFSS